MPFSLILLAAAVGMVTVFVAIPTIIRLFPPPRQREFHHSHKHPVSRLGGISLAVAFVLVAILVFFTSPSSLDSGWIVLISSLAMFGLGLWDDIRPLGARKKLLGQCIIASAVYFAGIQISQLKNPMNHEVYELGKLSYFVTVLWLVGFTNLINLIDGIDGLAGGISLMLMCLLIYVGLNGSFFSLLFPAGMAGALLGFLFFNFPPAKIYMGDGGAYFLGFFIGIMTMASSQKGTVAMALIAPLFALALPIIDVSVAIIRRGLRGLPIFRPDRKHIHHRLVEMGFSRVRAVLILYALSAVFLVFAFAVFWRQGRLLPFLFGLLCVTLLVAAGSIRFARDWFAIGQVLGNSMDMRKEIRYALMLARWIELEAERAESVAELWDDYKFMIRKLGFNKIRMILTAGEKNWEREVPATGTLFRVRHDFQKHNGLALEFEADESVMSEKLFEIITDLSAESWIKAVTRWQTLHERAVVFESDSPVSPAPSSPRFAPIEA